MKYVYFVIYMTYLQAMSIFKNLFCNQGRSELVWNRSILTRIKISLMEKWDVLKRL